MVRPVPQSVGLTLEDDLRVVRQVGDGDVIDGHLDADQSERLRGVVRTEGRLVVHFATSGDEADDRRATGVEEDRDVALDLDSCDVLESVTELRVDDSFEQLDAILVGPGEYHGYAGDGCLAVDACLCRVHAVCDAHQSFARSRRHAHREDVADGHRHLDEPVELSHPDRHGLTVWREAVAVCVVDDCLASSLDVLRRELGGSGLVGRLVVGRLLHLRRLVDQLEAQLVDDGTEHGSSTLPLVE